MKLHQLQALVAVSDTGSIRAAARRLGLSQTAVTKALRELETEQQLPLIARHASGVSFTDNGKALLAHARLMVGQLERANAELAQLRGLAEGRLTMGVTPWVALTFLPEVVRRFREAMPAVRLEIYEGLMAVTLPRLRTGEMDFVLGPVIPALPAQEFDIELLLQYESAVIARRGHPLAGCQSLHQLLDNDWVVNYAAASYDAFMDNLFWQHGARIDERRLQSAHSLSLLVELIRHADMLGYGPKPLLVTEPFRGHIEALTLAERFETSRLGIVSRRDALRNAAARCFVDCLLQVIRRRARSARTEDRELFDLLDLLI